MQLVLGETLEADTIWENIVNPKEKRGDQGQRNGVIFDGFMYHHDKQQRNIHADEGRACVRCVGAQRIIDSIFFIVADGNNSFGRLREFQRKNPLPPAFKAQAAWWYKRE